VSITTPPKPSVQHIGPLSNPRIQTRFFPARDVSVAVVMPEAVACKMFDDMPLWDDDTTWINQELSVAHTMSTLIRCEEINLVAVQVSNTSLTDVEYSSAHLELRVMVTDQMF